MTFLPCGRFIPRVPQSLIQTSLYKLFMKRSLFLILVAAGALHAEDYTFVARSSSLTGEISGYENVTANNISAGFAGSIGTIKNNNEFSISGNDNVTLENNQTTNKGGLFYLQQSAYTNPQQHTTLNITDNNNVTLSNNFGQTSGGIITADNNSNYPEYYSVTNISGNTGNVTISGNSSDGSGGAIWSNGKLNINNNGNVKFTGNAVNKANGNWGGAIYMGVSSENAFNISGNDYVEFRGNYLYKAKSNYVPEATVRLNSIYQKGTNQANTISAKTGGSVVFYDAVITESAGSRASYELNADYTDADSNTQKAGGTITFSGKYTQIDLDAFTDTVSNAKESQTSILSANTTLHNGTLNIEYDAVLQTKNLTINDDATLTLRNGACEVLTGGDLLFKNGSELSVTGSNILSADSITFEDNTVLTLTLSDLNTESAIINLVTSDLSFTQGTINFVGIDSLDDGQYMLLSLGESRLTAADLLTDNLTVSGLAAGDKLEWNETGTTLYLSHKSIPEPTTATLSLLALAGLAARRRRR